MDGSLIRKRKKNPRQDAGFISVATYFYTFPTFFHGLKKDFDENDLYQTYSGHKSSKLGDKTERLWNKELKGAKLKNKKASLRKVLLQAFGIEHLYTGLIILFNELVVKIYQVLALGELVSFYMQIKEQPDMRPAYFSAAKIIICSLFAVIIGAPASMRGTHLGIKLRIACCSLIYRKAIRLSKSAFAKTTSGQMVNFLSNDVKNFDKFANQIHYTWIAPVQTIVVTYFMYNEVGYSAIIGVTFLVLFIPLHFFMAKLSAVYRSKSAARTDDRIRLMNEIILGISVIKMYTWEEPFSKLIALYRRLEMKAIKIPSHLKGIYSVFVSLNSRIALFITILTYVLINDHINARQMFLLFGLYNLIRQTMIVFFPHSVSLIAETNVCLNRIRDFLLLDEAELNNHIEQEKGVDVQNALLMKNVTAKWNEATVDNTLLNLNLKIPYGSLTAVIGLVGSGKTSFFHAILKELPLTSGDIFVNGKISYASQEPWLFQESIQQNILFGSEMEKRRYNQVLESCALQKDLLHFPHSDKTIIGERGVTLSGGQRARINLARAVYREANIYLLDDCLSAVDSQVGKKIFHRCVKNHLKEKTVLLITHQLQYLKHVDYIIVFDHGSIVAQGSPLELQESGVDFAKHLNQNVTKDIRTLLSQTSVAESMGSKMSLDEIEIEAPVMVREQKSEGSISGYVYRSYIKAGGNWCTFSVTVALFILLQLFTSVADYFLAYWVNLEQNEKGDDASQFRKLCLIIYTGLLVVLIAVSVARSIVFVHTYIKASVNLHDSMFRSVISATMNFFSTNPSGRILNRFSKDIGAIDEVLPAALMDTVGIGLTVIGIVIVVGAVNPWIMIPVAIIVIIFYFLRLFYIGTSRNIKRLEGVMRTPVFAHLNASIQGLTTIRAFKAQKLLQEEFDNHQDLHTCSAYLFLATSKAFGYWLDLICVVYIAIVTLSSFVSKNELFGGNVGLIISQSLMLTGIFQWGMRQLAEAENQMTSVERVLEYNDIDHEPSTESNFKSESWPEHGEIKFIDVSLRYLNTTVLKSINFTIAPLQKVGIVGRTGAGKSSLVSALFRLADIEGAIMIDGVDTKTLGLHDLRSKISIIPQEPVLFSGSLRKNLDPFDEYDDDVIWKALEEVELKESIANLTSGINSEISEGGSNLSVGQRQLVCLARALLRNNKILIMDEATANVDPTTDALIQNTIRKNFAHCTVLTIAHRLDTVMDSDKVLVMDDGEVVEFDHPHSLLNNTSGFFYGMVQQTGRTMSKTLMDVADSNYEKLLA